MSTFVQYEATGTQAAFSVPFPYIAEAHVKVRLNGVLFVLGAHYDFTSPAEITFRPSFVPANGVVVDLRRETPSPALVNFQSGAVLTADDLNTAVKQAQFCVEEIRDYYEGRLEAGLSRIGAGDAVSATEALDAMVQEVLSSTLLAELQSRISDIDANAEAILGFNTALDDLQAQVDALGTIDGSGIGTLITNEQNARIAGDNALADTIALIGAKSGDNTAFIADLNTLKVSPTESLGGRLSALLVADGNNAAAITAEQVARANGDTALAGQISTLSSTVGANTASITTLQTVTGGLAAQYVVKLNVNGHVTGFGLYNEAGSSAFTIVADKFAVVSAAGGTAKVPFSISGGVVYAQDLVVKNANIENLAIGKLTSGALVAEVTQNADWTVGTGRIVYDSNPGNVGGYVRISGVGFGPSGQYLEWFGPKPGTHTTVANIIANLTDSAAIQYLKTNGSAYFGGTLAAGIIRNSGQTTDTSATAEIIVGSFLTNGGTKTIVVSYDYHHRYNCATGTGAITGATGAATIIIERSIGGGSWVQIGTLNATQSQREVIVDGEPGVPDAVTFRIAGSTTLTDNSASTSDMRLRARVSSRTLPTFGGTSKTNIVTTQNVTIVETE